MPDPAPFPSNFDDIVLSTVWATFAEIWNGIDKYNEEAFGLIVQQADFSWNCDHCGYDVDTLYGRCEECGTLQSMEVWVQKKKSLDNPYHRILNRIRKQYGNV